MKTELYQAETEKLCRLHESILDEACRRLNAGNHFSDMEKQGIIHSLQVLVENAIGKAKLLLKEHGCEVPVSAHDVFASLKGQGLISAAEQQQWRKAVGFRNTVVHEYMDVSEAIVFNIIRQRDYRKVLSFLRKSFDAFATGSRSG